jgi:hypothetical protein
LLLTVPEARASALRDAFAGAGHDLWELGAVNTGRGIVVR